LSKLTLDPLAFPDAATLQSEAKMGRLNIISTLEMLIKMVSTKNYMRLEVVPLQFGMVIQEVYFLIVK
jgi:hypothetical protein